MNTKVTSGSRPILVTRFSSLGDIILTEPALRLLRMNYPDTPIHYLTKNHYTEIAGGFAPVDSVFSYDRATGLLGLLRIAMTLRRNSYRLLVDLHGSIRSILVRTVVSADLTRKIKKNTVKRILLTRFGRNRSGHWPTAVERYLECVPESSHQLDTQLPRMKIERSDLAAADHMIRGDSGSSVNNSILDARPYIALAPGARWATKMWPARGYAELGAALAVKTGKMIVILGSRDDRDLCSDVAARIGENARDLSGRTTLKEAAAVLARSSLLVTNDSGLMHCATAVETPVVAIFGPTTRELGFFPAEEMSKVIEIDLPCRPCSTKGSHECPLGTFDCMKKITSEQVLSEALDMLERKRRVTA